MNTLSGLTAASRERLGMLVRGCKGLLTISYVAEKLEISSRQASIMLAYYAKNGWVSRIKRGLYMPLAMETFDAKVALKNTWLVASKCFAPCYIGGWTAVAYWGLTEQIYNDIMVYTAKNTRSSSANIQGAKFCFRRIYPKNIFGTKNIWINGEKILVSDPSRTIVDILDDPSIMGGIRVVIDVLREYLQSTHKETGLLLAYCKKLGKGVVYKRLGFLLEYLQVSNQALIRECLKSISKGKSKLDPKLPAEKLITKWQLWVPKNWGAENDHKN